MNRNGPHNTTLSRRVPDTTARRDDKIYRLLQYCDSIIAKACSRIRTDHRGVREAMRLEIVRELDK